MILLKKSLKLLRNQHGLFKRDGDSTRRHRLILRFNCQGTIELPKEQDVKVDDILLQASHLISGSDCELNSSTTCTKAAKYA